LEKSSVAARWHRGGKSAGKVLADDTPVRKGGGRKTNGVSEADGDFRG